MGAAAASVHGEPVRGGCSPDGAKRNPGLSQPRLFTPDYASLHPGYGTPLGWQRRLNPRHHHVFDLDIFFHAVMRAFAAEARFLDAAEGGDFGGDQAGVDADHAGFERLRYPPDPAEIARIEIG